MEPQVRGRRRRPGPRLVPVGLGSASRGRSCGRRQEVQPDGVCFDQCATGWIEDVRWRAEPTLVALAEKRRLPPPAGDLAAVVRLAQLTAVLAELVPGMLAASSSELRQTIRRGRSAPPSTHTWLFTLRQRLPARVHLSQVRPGTSADGQEGLLQIVSLDVAHVSALVVIASGRSAQETVGRSALNVELGPPLDAQDLDAQQRRAAASLRELDLARSPHPHQIAVHRLCAARDSTSPTPGG